MDLTKVTRDWNHADSFLDNKYNDTKKYVDNQINPEFVYDETAVSCKTVPDNVKDFAVVEKIYGKTIKDGETLKSAPIESVVSKSRNLFNGTPSSLNNAVLVSPGVWTNNATDTRTIAYLNMRLYKDTATYGNSLDLTTLSDGRQYAVITKTDSFNYITIGHSGSSKDIKIKVDLSELVNGETYTISALITGNPSVINGISLSMVQIEKGSSASAYTPYNKTTISVPESIKNLEGYGLGISDTVRNYVDFEAGKYYKYCGSVDLGSLTYTYDSSEGKGWFYTASAGINNAKAPTASEVGNFITGKYTTTSRNEIPNIDDAVCMLTTAKIIIKDTSAGTDPNVFKTALSGQMFVYELATPEVIDISDIIRPIKCETGGTITLVNEHNLDVANTIIYEREVSEHD